MLTKDALLYYMDESLGEPLANTLNKLLSKNGDKFNYETAEALASIVEAQIEQGAALPQDWHDYAAQYPLGKFICARMAQLDGRNNEALNLYSAIIDGLPDLDPYLLLQKARLLNRLGQIEEAARDLRLALSLNPDYTFFIKSEKLVQKIINGGKWTPRRVIRIAILGSTTTTFLASVLQVLCFRDGIKAVIYEGGYGAYQQEVIDVASGLYSFKPDVTVLVPDRRTFVQEPFLSAEAPTLWAENFVSLWKMLQHRQPCHIIHVTFDIPVAGSGGYLEDSKPEGRASIIRKTNLFLFDKLIPGVSIVDINTVAMECGDRFFSETEWYSSRQFPASTALPEFADAICAQIRAAFGLSAKVLVLDLDNTLWGGVIGEDGTKGIVLGAPSAEGEAYQDLQRYCKQLKERGILLAVCSKNNLSDAKLPFAHHDSMILEYDDFVLFTANWADKATNIRNMANDLSLGLDAFVFLDDNPLERAWVRANLPQVIVPECGKKPWEMLKTLQRGRYFESLALTKEDQERHSSYRANVNRLEFEKNASSLEEFLAGLDMRAESGPIDRETLSRVTQLINKTNQFNLTTRRYTEEQVQALSASADYWTRWYRLKDRFGDHGLIGVIIAKKENSKWYVNSWLMSCRVLGRQMEKFMCADLLKAALDGDAAEVYGQYIASAKNSLVADMYARLGFSPIKNNNFVFDLRQKQLPQCDFINRAEK